MPQTLGGIDAGGLEQSRTRRSDSIRFGPSAHGIERAEIYLSTCEFEPHRHDTYAIGITTAGVQTFHYRGLRRICLPGQLHVLHPDEAHDGAAGTDGGVGYPILYLPPQLVRDAFARSALPFFPRPLPPLVPAPPPLAPAEGGWGRAPTATVRCAAWRWRGLRSRAGNHLPELLPRPASLTKAT